MEADRHGTHPLRRGQSVLQPTQDYIQVPPKATFESLDEFYGTCFHELCHCHGARVPAELVPQGQGEHLRPWRIVAEMGRASCAGNWASRHRKTSKTTSPTLGTGSRPCGAIPASSS